jgi:hypothetical protein
MGGPSHRRLQRAISRYADGELDAAAASAMAAHLLECDECTRELAMVRAIKGSLRRVADAEPPTLAAARLRRWAAKNSPCSGVVPSHERGERGRVAVGTTSLSPGDRRRLVARAARRHRWRTAVGALAGVVAAFAATGAFLLQRDGASPEGGTVAALVELARLESPSPTATGDAQPAEQRQGHMLELGHQTVRLVRHLIDGREVLVATSDRAFPMPPDARPQGREPDSPWLARRGDIGVACLSHPTHRLLVGPLPAERLVEIGRQLPP